MASGSASLLLARQLQVMRLKKSIPVNLLELRPSRAVAWETTENGLVVLLVPRFRHPILVQWLLPLLAKKFFRVRLDEYGSFIWRMCDGTTQVSEMAHQMLDAFGPDAEPVYDRIGKFLGQLEREDLLVVLDPGAESGLA